VPANPEIRILPSATELFRAAAEQFASGAQQAVRQRGKFSVALSGGSTPKGLYSLLADGSVPGIPWEKIYFFWGDERHVPPDHPDSNYRMVREAMLSKVPVPEDHVFRVPAEQPRAEEVAREYEQTIISFFGLQPGHFPRFDLILLGLGPDGHTASLFPGTAGLAEQQRLVIANRVEKFNTYRISFTYPVLNSAAAVTFLVSGAEKAGILHRVLEEPGAGLPAQAVRPFDGSLVWLLDGAAAGALRSAAEGRSA
jgi:6-phosphogluconolactonase